MAKGSRISKMAGRRRRPAARGKTGMGKATGTRTAKPGLLARLFGAPGPKQAGPKRYAGPAKDRLDQEGGETGRLRAQLLVQIKTLRAKLNPQLVRLAESVARKGPPATDHDRAQMAVGLFLAQKKDGGDYAAKLKARLDDQKRRSH